MGMTPTIIYRFTPMTGGVATGRGGAVLDDATGMGDLSAWQDMEDAAGMGDLSTWQEMDGGLGVQIPVEAVGTGTQAELELLYLQGRLAQGRTAQIPSLDQFFVNAAKRDAHLVPTFLLRSVPPVAAASNLLLAMPVPFASGMVAAGGFLAAGGAISGADGSEPPAGGASVGGSGSEGSAGGVGAPPKGKLFKPDPNVTRRHEGLMPNGTQRPPRIAWNDIVPAAAISWDDIRTSVQETVKDPANLGTLKEMVVREFAKDPDLRILTDGRIDEYVTTMVDWTALQNKELFPVHIDPSFLATRFKFEVVLERFGVHPHGNPLSFGQMARAYGIKTLSRRIPLENLIGLLKRKSFSPGDGLRVGDENPVARTSLSADTEEISPIEGFAVVVMPADALDLFSWSHANINWDFGRVTPLSAMPDNMFEFFLIQVAALELQNNEIIFTQPVELDRFASVKYVVPEAERQKVLSEIEQLGIEPVNGVPWNEAIISSLPDREAPFPTSVEDIQPFHFSRIPVWEGAPPNAGDKIIHHIYGIVEVTGIKKIGGQIFVAFKYRDAIISTDIKTLNAAPVDTETIQYKRILAAHLYRYRNLPEMIGVAYIALHFAGYKAIVEKAGMMEFFSRTEGVPIFVNMVRAVKFSSISRLEATNAGERDANIDEGETRRLFTEILNATGDDVVELGFRYIAQYPVRLIEMIEEWFRRRGTFRKAAGTVLLTDLALDYYRRVKGSLSDLIHPTFVWHAGSYRNERNEADENYVRLREGNADAISHFADRMAEIVRREPLLWSADAIVAVPGREKWDKPVDKLAEKIGVLVEKPVLTDMWRSRPKDRRESEEYIDFKSKEDQAGRIYQLKLNRRADVQGKTIILIDDNITTGATARAAAFALRAAGAAKVLIVVATRTFYENPQADPQ